MARCTLRREGPDVIRGHVVLGPEHDDIYLGQEGSDFLIQFTTGTRHAGRGIRFVHAEYNVTMADCTVKAAIRACDRFCKRLGVQNYFAEILHYCGKDHHGQPVYLLEYGS